MNTLESGAKPSTMAGTGVHPDTMPFTPRSWRRSAIVWICLIATVCLLLLIASYQARNNSDNIPAAQAGTEPAAAANAAAVSIAADQSHWRYSMENGIAGHAERTGCLDSGGMVFLGEPYNSEHASLCFRSDGIAFLRLDGDGRIASGAGYDATVQIGDGPVKKIATLKSGDQSLGVAVLSPAAALFAAARTGKQIAVTATYDQDVMQPLTFAPQEPLRLDD
jgi:hypothetical protein